MFGITDLTTYIIGAIAVILLPGPNSIFCLTTSAKQGVKAGYQVMLGILVGDSILMLATVFGAGALLKLYPILFNGIKLIGGLYLAYLGVNLIKAGVQKWQTRQNPTTATDYNANDIAKTNYFSHALMLSLTNPKAILFFLSFFIPFVDPNYENPLLSFLILAIILQIISFLYLNTLIFSGHHLTKHFAKRVKLASISLLVVGVMFLGFAVKLWTASL